MIEWLAYKIFGGGKRLYLRYLQKIIRKSLSQIDDSSTFTFKCTFLHPENIVIGKNTYLNGGMFVAGDDSKIIIGDNCLISYNVHMRTSSHNHSVMDVPIREQGESQKDIVIGNNVWIGYGAQILSGVIIGDNSIVGAGAVVTRSIPENCIYGGVPAKLIRER